MMHDNRVVLACTPAWGPQTVLGSLRSPIFFLSPCSTREPTHRLQLRQRDERDDFNQTYKTYSFHDEQTTQRSIFVGCFRSPCSFRLREISVTQLKPFLASLLFLLPFAFSFFSRKNKQQHLIVTEYLLSVRHLGFTILAPKF